MEQQKLNFIKSTSFRSGLILFVLTALAVGGYLYASARMGFIGFPLDDAWIHQTYARNFSTTGQWAFILGQPSAGSTSPLWSAFLSLGYLMGLAPYGFTYFLGGLCLFSLGFIGERLVRSQVGSTNNSIPWVGIFLVGEWHLVWAAASGMETTLFALLIMGIFFLLSLKDQNWILTGALIGLSVWVRPDGITLLGPALFVLVFQKLSKKEFLWSLLKLLISLVVVTAIYLVFTKSVSGNWLPNTFFAKQAEYAIYQNIPLIKRLINLSVLPMVGAGVLLVPGVVYAAWWAYRRKWLVGITAVLWWLGYTLVYALRLPVTYQHGRYLMPAMPVYFMLGLLGTGLLADKYLRQNRWRWIIGRAWILAIGAVWIAFYGLGAVTYSNDVAIIQTEMVAAAKWVAVNTESNALIAAHDIGALGYFGQRNLLDLAGLVSPEVIPFIRDEQKLASYLDEKGADYLVTFPGWYPYLTSRAEPVYHNAATYSIKAGGENMWIYRWSRR